VIPPPLPARLAHPDGATAAGGGLLVTPQRFDWFALVLAPSGGGWRWVGSGAVVAPGWLLTAAHLHVLSGSHAIRRGIRLAGGPRAPVESVEEHPGWTRGRHPDMCLLRFRPDGGTVCPWSEPGGQEPSFLGKNESAHGARLQQVALQREDDGAACSKLLGDDGRCGRETICGRTCHPETRGRAEMQEKDSGAPLVERDPQGTFRVVGCLSRGRPEAALALATLITDDVARWIREVTGSIPG
jgi:hypothetical protein